MQRSSFPKYITNGGVTRVLHSRDRSWVKDATSPCPKTGRPMCIIMQGRKEVIQCSRGYMEKFQACFLEWKPHIELLDPNREHVKIFSVDGIPDWLRLQDEDDERLAEERRRLIEEKVARYEEEVALSRRVPSPAPSPAPEYDESLPDWHPAYRLPPGPEFDDRLYYYESDSDIDEVDIPRGTIIQPRFADRDSDPSTWRVVPGRAPLSSSAEAQSSLPLESSPPAPSPLPS